MAIFNQFRVINPEMLVETTWLDDIVTARVPLLVLRNFLPSDMRETVVRDLQLCREKSPHSRYSDGTSTLFGSCLAQHMVQPENYFTELRDTEPALPSSLLLLRQQIYNWVCHALKLESLQIAHQPDKGHYSGSRVRFYANGMVTPLYNHNIVRDTANTDLVVKQVMHQLSCTVCLQECKAGGALRIYNKKWSPEDERFKTADAAGYQNALIDRHEICEISPRSGDIYLFNPAFYHETQQVVGDEGITMDFFFGLIDKKMKHAIAWS